jgi:hypothetical protein
VTAVINPEKQTATIERKPMSIESKRLKSNPQRIRTIMGHDPGRHPTASPLGGGDAELELRFRAAAYAHPEAIGIVNS